ncbi:hypothetical protein PV08_05287 [Exophiala spinifera]|uniref:Uncharacterized protein n=1 Tax=Exophiala spinifera TaxID=91928 RepID=A0A0D1ZR01_9EURO|nr:uncharacterized protein PV08_05287 [Exophiala spinifera]KIW15242.1 hypothetical protein PV08_05287 [Exophiala spinifera]
MSDNPYSYSPERSNDRSIDSLYFSNTSTRSSVGTNPGGQSSSARSESTLDNWGAEIDRRYIGNTSSRDFAYDKSDPKHTTAYLLPDKKR